MYQNSEGDTLTVRVVDVSERMTGRLGGRPAFVFNWTVDVAGEASWRFQEAVGLADGAIIQQVAFCGATGQQDGKPACLDDRALISFSASGLPGAFGIAPFWGTSISPGETHALEVTNPLQDTELERSASETSLGCVRLSTDAPPPQPTRALAETVWDGTVEICEGVPLPTTFDSIRSGTFELLDRQEGAGEPIGLEDTADTSGPGLRVRGVRAPLLVDDSTYDTSLPVREAHRVAMERSEPYRSLFEESSGHLVGTTFRHDGHSSTLGGTAESERYHRSLFAMDEGGTAVQVTIQKTQRNPGPTTYTIIDEQEGAREVTWSADGFKREQTTLGAVVEAGKTFAGTDVDQSIGVRESIALKGDRWLGRAPVLLTEGYAIVSWHDDPRKAGPEQGTSGVHYQIPYETVAHGPSASLLWIEVQPDDLPIKGPPPG